MRQTDDPVGSSHHWTFQSLHSLVEHSLDTTRVSQTPIGIEISKVKDKLDAVTLFKSVSDQRCGMAATVNNLHTTCGHNIPGSP
jgi:hypothetical protein